MKSGQIVLHNFERVQGLRLAPKEGATLKDLAAEAARLASGLNIEVYFLCDNAEVQVPPGAVPQEIIEAFENRRLRGVHDGPFPRPYSVE